MTSRHHRGLVQDVPPHKFYTCNKLACFGEATSLKSMVAEWYKIHKKKGSWNFEGEVVWDKRELSKDS